MQHFTLINHCWFIRILVIVAWCPRQWSEDFMTFMLFTGLQTFKVKFSENSLWSNILNHLQTKVTPKSPHSAFSLIWSWRSESFGKLNFLNFGLPNGQKFFNATCNCIFLHFWAAIMDFLNILKCSVFFLLIKLQGVSYPLSNIIFVGYVLQIKTKL